MSRTCRPSREDDLLLARPTARTSTVCFPGGADGTLSERIALVLTRDVIERATHVVDLHCGDGNESLRPTATGSRPARRRSPMRGSEMALAFGLDHIVVDRRAPDRSERIGLPVEHRDHARQAGVDDRDRRARAHSTRNPSRAIERGSPGCSGIWGCAPMDRRRWRSRFGSSASEVLRASVTGIFHPAVERGHTWH